jgi:hypothetical protein
VLFDASQDTLELILFVFGVFCLLGHGQSFP